VICVLLGVQYVHRYTYKNNLAVGNLCGGSDILLISVGGEFLAGPGIYYLHSDKTGVQIEIWGVGNKNRDYVKLSALLKGQFIIRQSQFHH
jgi:hypothetical protein